MATLLTCSGITKSYGLRTLFEGLSISFGDDERIGFIGPNGAGKTTFLRILAGLDVADAGEITGRRSTRIAYLPQQERFAEGATVEGVLTEALAGSDLQAHERETRINIILGKFGFTPEHDRVETLSGGWRKRLAIAREVIREPDLLLMDEPTNHLDLDGIAWLEELLLRASFAFVAVSHDRYFLERVTNRVVELNPVYPEGYFSVRGTYSDFLDKRADLLEAQQAQEESLANIVRRESAFLKSNAKAQRSKSKARIEEAYRLQDDLRSLRERNAQGAAAAIDFEATGRRTRKLLEAQEISKALGGRRLFAGVSLMLSPGTRLGLVGPNGSGKTTLIRVLAGDLPPDSGTIRRAEDLRVVLFDQRREQLPQDITLRRALSAYDTVEFRGKPVHVTAWAKRFLFRLDQLDLPVAELSGGEQARILIARLMTRPADILILDEPTNDLDITSLEVLEESLVTFPGAIVLVTHDRFMLDRVCTEYVGLDGRGEAGLYSDWSQWQTARARSSEAAPAGEPKTGRPPAKKPRRGGLTASEQKELQDMEHTIEEAETRVAECERALADPQLGSDYAETEKRWNELQAARQHVESLFARWQELEAKREG